MAPMANFEVIFSRLLLLGKLAPIFSHIGLIVCDKGCKSSDFQQTENEERLNKSYGESTSSVRMVIMWFKNSWRNRRSTSSGCSGSTLETSTPEIVNKIHFWRWG